MEDSISSTLGELINEEGEHLLAHGVGVCSHDEAIYTVIEWCGSYWVDFECGHISGPWCTLEAALRNTPAGWLQPGGIHDVFAVSLEPRAIASMLVLVGGGTPRELTINGREWEWRC
jgi:hypothetical protein